MSIVKLSGECTIYEISKIHEKIMAGWDNNKGLVLDLSGVTDIDASFIQLLLSCKQSVQQEQDFELKQVPKDLSEKLDFLRLRDFLYPPEAKGADSISPESPSVVGAQ